MPRVFSSLKCTVLLAALSWVLPAAATADADAGLPVLASVPSATTAERATADAEGAATGVAAGTRIADLHVICARSFYTDEEFGQLIVRGRGGQEDETRGTARISWGDRVLAAAAPVRRGRYLTVRFPLDALPLGTTPVTCRLNSVAGMPGEGVAAVTRLAPRAFAVAIDRISGGLIVDGLPFFPFGFYCYSPVQPTLAEEEVVRGFNMMSPYQTHEPQGLEARREYMDRCAELGMKVHYQLLSVSEPAAGLEDSVAARKEDWLRREVRAFRDHPALLAWYISDEPTGSSTPPEVLQRSYRIVRELDPYHPISIVFMAPNKAAEYTAGMDLVMTDPYPIPGPIASVPRAVDAITSVFQADKPVWLVPQAFGGNEHWRREPTAAEARVMTYLGIVHGATGIQYFIRHGLNGFPKSPVMWNACSRAALEVQALTPALLSHEARPRVSSASAGVEVAAWRDRGVITVIAVNTVNAPDEIVLRLDGLDFNGSARVLYEDRAVTVRARKPFLLARLLGMGGERGACLRDMIDAYGVRIYQLQVEPPTGVVTDTSGRNRLLNAGFEESHSPSLASAMYAGVGAGRGATYFADGRVAWDGRTSIRLHTPRAGEGVHLSPYSPAARAGKCYRFSLRARLSRPGTHGQLTLSCGGFTGHDTRRFPLSAEWRELAMDGCMGADVRRAALSFWMDTPGTAFVDAMQFYDISPRIIATARPGGFQVRMESLIEGAELRYALRDGVSPQRNWEDVGTETVYREPFVLEASATVRCTAWQSGVMRAATEVALHHHAALGRSVELQAPFSPRYPAGGRGALTDGILGSSYFNDGNWQGFEAEDLTATIDLGSVQPLAHVKARFLQTMRSWIWLPVRVTVEISTDGATYRPLGALDSPVGLREDGAIVHEFVIAGAGEPARFVRLQATNLGVCPPWHAGAGGKPWVFCDEIRVFTQDAD